MKKEILPKWDLSDLYSSKNSKRIISDFEILKSRSRKFTKEFKGELISLSQEEFYKSIKNYEFIQDIYGKLSSYCDLLSAENFLNKENSTFVQSMREKLNIISSSLIFYELEITTLPTKKVKELLKDTRNLKYKYWINNLIQFKEYRLDENIEKIFFEKTISGKSAWCRLFDETIAEILIKIDDKEINLEECLDLLSSESKSMRKKSALAISAALDDKNRIFSLITNTLSKDKEIEDRWRSYKDIDSERHMLNGIEQEVVDSLVNSVKKSYPKISHRYYKLKARYLKQTKLNFWDRNAPIFKDDNKQWEWDTGVNLVLEAYRGFSEEMFDIGKRFFENSWIDAALNTGKAGGAFSHPTIPSVHPYILLNYQGKLRDIMTLAHELGHGIHQVLSSGHGVLLADTPLTLAETASVFGEHLVFGSILNNTKDLSEKKKLLSGKIEDSINTVIRQISFYDFEKRVHFERKKGELKEETIGKIWLESQAESLGPVFQLGERYKNYWSYIPHFIHTPFYVYAYAFRECLVNSLYSLYKEDKLDFKDNYIKLLNSGGSKDYKDLLLPFNLDPSLPDFWHRGLREIEKMIDELEMYEFDIQ